MQHCSPQAPQQPGRQKVQQHNNMGQHVMVSQHNTEVTGGSAADHNAPQQPGRQKHGQKKQQRQYASVGVPLS
jgi:hypothetical protein